MKISHEKRVERFYSHGSDKRCHEADWFLNFWYWKNNPKDYFEAAKELLAYVIQQRKLTKAGNILNVACGYGAETFRLYDTIKPQKIYAIDITRPHIDFANQKAKQLNLHEKISFEHNDACALSYADNSFSHVIGVEWPGHFNPRIKFFSEAYRVLEHKGELLLTDIIIQSENFAHHRWGRLIGRFGWNVWRMPKANRWGLEVYKKQLEDIWFKDITVEKIGKYVYKWFSKYNLKRASIGNAIRQRGFWIGLWLTTISRLLMVAHRFGFLEYVLVRAVKA